MLSRLPVLAPIGWRLDCEAASETRPLNNTTPQKTAPQKPLPREAAALFQEVSLPRTTTACVQITCDPRRSDTLRARLAHRCFQLSRRDEYKRASGQRSRRRDCSASTGRSWPRAVRKAAVAKRLRIPNPPRVVPLPRTHPKDTTKGGIAPPSRFATAAFEPMQKWCLDFCT